MKTKKKKENRNAEIENIPITKEQFIEAGNYLDPINVETAIQAETEMKFLFQTIKRNSKPDNQILAIQRFMALIKGGIFNFMEAKNKLKNLHTGLYSALTSTKSELIIETCFLLGQIAPKIGTDFDQVGDYLKPLAFKIGNEVELISECCKLAFLAIIENCPSITFFNSIVDIIRDKGPKQKAVMCECFCKIIQLWPLTLLHEILNSIVTLLNKMLLEEASPQVRKFSKIAACTLTQLFPNDEEKFFGNLPDKLRLSIPDEEPMEIRERIVIFHTLPIQEPATKRRKAAFSNDQNDGNAPNTNDDPKVGIKEFKAQLKATAEKIDEEKATKKQKPKVKRTNNNYWKPYEIKKPPRVVKTGDFIQRNAPEEVSIEESKHLDPQQKERLIEKLKIEEEKKQKIQQEKAQKSKTKLINGNTKPKKIIEDKPSDETDAIIPMKDQKNLPFLQRCGPKETTIENSKHIKESEKEKLKQSIKRQKILDVQKKRNDTSSSPVATRKASPEKDEYKSPSRIVYKTRKSPKKIRTKTGPILHRTDGLENDYLAEIQEKINDIPEKITISVPEFLFCCSHNSAIIQSTAISMLPDLYPRISFDQELSDLIAMLLKNTNSDKINAQSASLFALNEIPRHFDTIFILKICCEQEPSYQLVKFTYSLLETCDCSKIDTNLVKHLCLLAFKCVDTKPIKSTHISGFIIRKCCTISYESVIEFGNKLNNEDLREFQDFATSYYPDLLFRKIAIDIPPVTFERMIEWLRKIETIIQKVSVVDWQTIRAPLFIEINKALLSNIEIDRSLRLLQSIFTYYGYNDYTYVLSGIIRNKCEISDSIIIELISSEFDKIDEFITHLQPLIKSEIDGLNAVKIQTKILKLAKNKDKLYDQINLITESLELLLQSKKIEFRQASVLCYVELFAAFGMRSMEEYIKKLSKSNRDLILVLCAKKKVI